MGMQNQDNMSGDPCCSEQGAWSDQEQMGGGAAQWAAMGNGSQGGGAISATATQVTSAAKRQISKAAEQARSYATQRIDEGKQRAAEELSHAAHAVRAAAEKLREDRDERLAGYAETAAQWADQTANYIRDLRLEDVAQDTRNIVRQKPEWVLGGLFVAGLALGRFLKASSEPQFSSEYDSQMAEGWAPESGQADPQRHSPPHSPAHGPSSVTGVSTI